MLELRTHFDCLGQVECTSAICTGRIDCGLVVSTDRVFTQNNVYVNNFNGPFISYQYTSVTEYNESRQINIPITATNAFIYLYFGDVGSHTLFIKEGNSYNKRMGPGGNGWDFCETWAAGNHITCWYHWRSVGDRITTICYWFN